MAQLYAVSRGPNPQRAPIPSKEEVGIALGEDIVEAVDRRDARGQLAVPLVRQKLKLKSCETYNSLAACCCSPRPIIGMNEHWTTLTRRRPLVMHGWPSGARVSRHPAAGSQHSYGVDSTTRRFRADVPASLKRVHAPTTPDSLVFLG